MRGGNMAFKNSKIISVAVLVMVLALLTSPCFSEDGVDLKPGEEIYEIDYKGPETHTFIPPPRSKFGPHKAATNLVPSSKSKGLNSASGHFGRNGKNTKHGG